jgi:Pentapeptide repeats (8 copies)
MEIKNRFNDLIILCGEYENIKDCLEKNKGAYLSGADLSGADLSGADLSGANLSRADLSGAYLFEADLSGAYLFEADLSGVYLFGANLSRADLSGAYLSRADLSRADLSGANLSRADLSGANLFGAYLSGAKNIKLPIISITGSKHSLWSQNDKHIHIGCEDHTISEWKKNYKIIGAEYDYTEEQIVEYYQYVLQIEKFYKI